MALVETHRERSASSVAPTSTSLTVQNVLFATDLSSASEAAVPYAASICRRFGSTLHLAHVLSDTGLLTMTGGVDYVSLGTIYEEVNAEARARLDQISACVGEMPVRCHVRHGQVWANLSEIVKANEIDLIVVGTHGRSSFGKLLLGSVAETILRRAPCPVLTVGPNVSGHAKLAPLDGKHRDVAPIELELRQILLATDFSRKAERTAQVAIALAQEFRSRLTALHVIEDYAEVGAHPGPIEDGLRRLQELIPNSVPLQCKPERMLEFGSATDCILKIAADREADMIVLGARSSAEVGTTHLPWSTTHHTLAHAHCPVLTVRG